MLSVSLHTHFTRNFLSKMFRTQEARTFSTPCSQAVSIRGVIRSFPDWFCKYMYLKVKVKWYWYLLILEAVKRKKTLFQDQNTSLFERAILWELYAEICPKKVHSVNFPSSNLSPFRLRFMMGFWQSLKYLKIIIWNIFFILPQAL